MVRQVLCETRACELLPSDHSSVGSGRSNSTSMSGGLNPEPVSSTVPLSSVKPRKRKRKVAKRVVKGSRKASKSQVGGKRSRKQKASKKKCANKRKR